MPQEVLPIHKLGAGDVPAAICSCIGRVDADFENDHCWICQVARQTDGSSYGATICFHSAMLGCGLLGVGP